MSNGSASIVQPSTTSSTAKQPAARTRLLLEGPIVSTLLRLAAPNLVVNVVLIAVTATVDAHFVGQMGPGALAGISLVFPMIMLMQQMANSSMGGAIASAVARAIGAGRHADGRVVYSIKHRPCLVHPLGTHCDQAHVARHASRSATVRRDPARRRADVAPAYPQQSGACLAHGFRRRLGRGATRWVWRRGAP